MYATGSFQKFPDGWVPDRIAFHPTDPILLHVVKRPAVQGSPVLWCHSLLEPSLRLLGVQTLDVLVHSCGASDIRIDPQRYELHNIADLLRSSSLLYFFDAVL